MKRSITLFFAFALTLPAFSGNWTGIGSALPAPAKVALVSTDGIHSTVHFSLNGFYLNPVQTSKGEAQIITLDKSSFLLEKNAPELPKLTASVVIPDQAGMQVRVVASNYLDFPGVLIAPSKGVLTRDIDPSTVPYEFGPEYNSDQFFPGSLTGMRDPYIIRDVRGQTIIAYPFQYNPVTRVLRVYYDITVEIYKASDNGINPLVTGMGKKQLPQDFASVLNRHFLNFDAMSYSPLEEYGNLLVISYGSFMDAIRPYVEWKIAEGYQTELINVDSIGTTAAQIKTFIADYYTAHGLTHVLLVGDGPQIPTNTGSGLGGPSDNAYGYIVGNDHYSDVFIGRFSAENVAQVETQVQRTLDYEKNPQYLEDDWYTTVTGIASSQGPGDDNEMDYEHIRNQQTQLLAYTYTLNPELFDGSQGGNDAPGNPTPALVATEVNNGTSLMLYTGHGSKTAWSSSNFSNTNVNQLQNAGKLPFIWSVACVNGEFMTGSPCFAEAWLRASQNGQPTGAVAFLGSTINQSWNSPMEGQDEMTDILAESYPDNIKRTFAGISMNGCMKMIDSYGSDGKNMADTWTVFGDPTIMVRTSAPTAMTVTNDPSVMAVDSAYLVVCDVPGARATLSMGDSIVATGIIQNDSLVLDYASFNITEIDTMVLVVTAYNRLPYIDDIVIYPDVNISVGFTAFPTEVIPGNTVSFSDTSYGFNLHYLWSFPGGNPETSTRKEPIVTYENRGIFDVQLIVTNGITTDTLLKEGYITVDFPASVNPVGKAAACNVAPNPSNGKFNITLTSGNADVFRVTIYDLVGNAVYIKSDIAVAGTTEIKVDLQGFPRGLYFLKASGASGETITQKVMIK